MKFLFHFQICVLPLRLTEDHPPSLKDTTSWHVVRASLCAIRRFLEISLLLWIDKVDPSLASLFDEPPRSVAAAGYRPITYTPEQLSRLFSLVIARIRPDTVWPPTQQLRECGAISVLYRIIARNVYAHNSWPCRNECTRLAVDILNLMSITYDLADEVASADVYSFPSGLNSSSAAFLGSSPLFSSLAAVADSPRSGTGSADVTVHLPSPSGAGIGGVNRGERRGLLNQLLELVEQVGTRSSAWDVGSNVPNRTGRRGRDRQPGGRNEPASAAGSGDPTSDGQGRPGGSDVSDPTNDGNTTDEAEADERVNGLHMLFSISREDDGWDVAVHKSILAFVCTLVYRPIVEHEHPDNPIPATRVLAQLTAGNVGGGSGSYGPPNVPPPPNHSRPGATHFSPPSFKTPHRIPVNSVSRPSRKRRLDESSTQPLFLPSLPPEPGSSNSLLVSSASLSPSATSRCSSPGTLSNPFSESCMPSPLGRQKQTRLLYRQSQLWNIVRRQHGIMALLFHLETKQPISDADSVRTLACRGLVGLARSEEVRSMLAKMPLFTKALLQRLHNSAETLQREAHLKVVHNAPTQIPLYDDFSRPPGETPPYQPTLGCIPDDHLPSDAVNQPANISLLDSSQSDMIKTTSDFSVAPMDTVGSNGDGIAEMPLTPNLRLIKIRSTAQPTQTPKPYRDRFERPGIPNLYLKPVSNPPVPEMTLSKVVESFLLHQHAQCPHPVSVCPKFSLYHPHRCPEPRPNKQSNCCQRLLSREALYGSLRLHPSNREDRHFLHRRFQPTAVIREAEDDLLSACCFSLTDDGLFIGATSGAIAWVNVEEDGMPVELFHVQTSTIRRLDHTRDGERLLVCSEWGEPATVVARLRSASSGSGSANNSPWEAASDDFV
ncbi:uncharacterized protein DEA37_0009134 [Paragonimus westermani]|uniref:Uncharacterized protein n=1 Tax=Paragonimus westermani TaxID=34504 RepID=A0A5J4NLI2_9TREM|nr:uncharacterized protein DEA37_0009134 [Paragonimus westermani]